MQYRRNLFCAAVAALLLAFAPLTQATPLDGTVLGDAGQPVDGALVRLSPAAVADSFERDFDGWTFHQDIADLSTVDRSTEIAYDGDWSAMFQTTGRYDDGTAWLQQTFTVEPHTSYVVHLSWEQTNLFTSDIGNWPVVAYAGTTAPQVEGDFTEVGRDSQAEGFSRYELNDTVTTDASGQVVLAFGVSVVFEVDRAHFFDQVRPSLVNVADVVETQTDADGTFSEQVSPGLYRVGAQAKGFLSDVDVPVNAGSEDASLVLVKLEDVWTDELDARLVESAGSGEKLFVFASLTTPSGVYLEDAQCIGRLSLADGTSRFLTSYSDNGTCTFRYEPSDGTVPRGSTGFEVLDVGSEGKTHAPERSTVSPAKFLLQ